MKKQSLVNIGFGNMVVNSRIVAVVNSNTSPMKKFREDAKLEGRLVDATQGRKTRSIVITDSNHCILSAIQPETITQRCITMDENDE